MSHLLRPDGTTPEPVSLRTSPKKETALSGSLFISPRSGGEGNRTPDLLNAIQALSQLSYTPACFHSSPGRLSEPRRTAWSQCDIRAGEISAAEPRRISEGRSEVKKTPLALFATAGNLQRPTLRRKMAAWASDVWSGIRPPQASIRCTRRKRRV